MTWSPGFVLRVILGKSAEVLRRTRSAGFRSGRTCAKTSVVNSYLRVRNRLCRNKQVICPCCGWRGYRFLTIDCGRFVVPDAECPHCRGHERHRMLHLYLSRRTPGFMRGQGLVLHFAPERQVAEFIESNPKLKRIALEYDFNLIRHAKRPGIQCDIHHLPFGDNLIQGLFCLHVLEHVADDRHTVRELHRCLKPGGEAIIMVPFMMDQTETIEYPEPDPNMYDHVRGYSPLDFKERLGPFVYDEIMPGTFLTFDETRRFAIPDSQVIYHCRKGDGSPGGSP